MDAKRKESMSIMKKIMIAMVTGILLGVVCLWLRESLTAGGKELMRVLACYNAEELVTVEDISIGFFTHGHSGEIYFAANCFVLEASMHNIFHPFFLFL